jgi:hypothetical protein
MAMAMGTPQQANTVIRKRYYQSDGVHLEAYWYWTEHNANREDLGNEGHLLRMWLIVNKLYFVMKASMP